MSLDKFLNISSDKSAYLNLISKVQENHEEDQIVNPIIRSITSCCKPWKYYRQYKRDNHFVVVKWHGITLFHHFSRNLGIWKYMESSPLIWPCNIRFVHLNNNNYALWETFHEEFYHYVLWYNFSRIRYIGICCIFP